MMRALPPAGHSIGLAKAFGTLLSSAEGPDFLVELVQGRPVFRVSSGTAALTFALQSLKGISDRRKVILPAYTCPSVLASVIKAELEPVLCDLEPSSFRLNMEQLASKLSPEILAVVAVHLFGLPENIHAIREATRRTGTFLIEDAAQAFGNKVPPDDVDANSPEYLGTLGDIGIFSFGRGKPLSLLGGGAVVVNNRDLLDCVRARSNGLPNRVGWVSSPKYLLLLMLYSIFFHPRFFWIPSSMPWLRLGETYFTLEFEVAAMEPLVGLLGRQLIEKFREIREQRILLARQYTERLAELRDAFDFLPQFEEDAVALLRFPVVFKSGETRNTVLEKLKAGLGVTGMYPVPLHRQEGAEAYVGKDGPHPVAESIARGILTLPLHEHVRDRDVESIAETIEASVGN
jgi:dTDP-4-amino-4,6-dideoxygalactose transaminase